MRRVKNRSSPNPSLLTAGCTVRKSTAASICAINDIRVERLAEMVSFFNRLGSRAMIKIRHKHDEAFVGEASAITLKKSVSPHQA